MGWAERNNPNSEWYKKRHPIMGIQKYPIFEDKPERKSLWKKILALIKVFFCLPK